MRATRTSGTRAVTISTRCEEPDTLQQWSQGGEAPIAPIVDPSLDCDTIFRLELEVFGHVVHDDGSAEVSIKLAQVFDEGRTDGKRVLSIETVANELFLLVHGVYGPICILRQHEHIICTSDIPAVYITISYSLDISSRKLTAPGRIVTRPCPRAYQCSTAPYLNEVDKCLIQVEHQRVYLLLLLLLQRRQKRRLNSREDEGALADDGTGAIFDGGVGAAAEEDEVDGVGFNDGQHRGEDIVDFFGLLALRAGVFCVRTGALLKLQHLPYQLHNRLVVGTDAGGRGLGLAPHLPLLVEEDRGNGLDGDLRTQSASVRCEALWPSGAPERARRSRDSFRGRGWPTASSFRTSARCAWRLAASTGSIPLQPPPSHSSPAPRS
jgi:hypothetical protein